MPPLLCWFGRCSPEIRWGKQDVNVEVWQRNHCTVSKVFFQRRPFLRMAPALLEMLPHTLSSTWLTAAHGQLMGCACSELDTSPVPWHGFGNGFMTSNYFQMHSWGGIAKTCLSISIIGQRWSRMSRVWKGCKIPYQAKISARSQTPAPKALVVGLGPMVGSASLTQAQSF